MKNFNPIKNSTFTKKIFYAGLMLSAASLFQLFFITQVSAATLVKVPTGLGLIGYWSLNEGVGTIAHDFSGNGKNGTLVSSPAWVPGEVGDALSFNTTNDVQVSNFNINSSALTVSFWFNTKDASTVRRIVEDNWSTGSFTTSISLGTVNAIFNYVSGQGTTLTASGITANTWYHLTMTYDGTTARLYLNGVLKSSAVDNGTLKTSNTTVYIGSTGSFEFNGLIDEVRIYNRALSQAEITTLYKSSATKITTANTTSGSPLAVNTEDNKLTKGLVGFWSFNVGDISGTTALDRSGQGNNGTLTNSPTATAGKVGQALTFNGTNQYVNLGSTSAFDFGNATSFTISAWAKSTASGNQRILSNGHFGSTNGFLLKPSSTDAGLDASSAEAGIGAGGSQANAVLFSGTVTTNDGKWHLITATFDENAQIAKMYIDGVQSSIDKATGFCGTISGLNLNYSGCSVNANHSVNTTIGDYSTGGGEFLNGSIDEVRIYNRALSASEVQQLYQTGLVIINGSQTNRSLTGLIGYWTFDGKNMNWGSNTATDSSGNGDTGTLINMSTTTSPVAGRVGQALTFNGTNQDITVPTNSIFNTSTLSVCAWVKPNSFSNYQSILAKSESSSFEQFGLLVNASGQVAFQLGQFGTAFLGSLSIGKWSHICGTTDGTTGTLYINAISQGTGTDAKSYSSSYPFRIGNTPYQSNSRYFNGAIDEVRVYNTTLSIAQVKQLYLLGK